MSESPLSQGKLDMATLMRNLARFCWVMYLRAGKQKQTAPRSWFTCQRVQPGPGPRLSRAHAGCSSLLLTAALKRALRILEREISALPSKTSSKPWGLSRTPAEPVLLSPSKALCAFTALRFVCLFACFHALFSGLPSPVFSMDPNPNYHTIFTIQFKACCMSCLAFQQLESQSEPGKPKSE